LVDDLLARGYQNISVLDVSETVIDVTRKRLKEAAERISWIVGDVTKVVLDAKAYDVWHDRAVFHFLTSNEQRAAYVESVAHAVRAGGHVIIGTFGPEGPTKCSGLDVMRYDAESLHDEFGRRFRFSREFEGAARDSVRNHTAVSVLLLPDRKSRTALDLAHTLIMFRTSVGFLFA
jgi:SAM-dependent methyltransferase